MQWRACMRSSYICRALPGVRCVTSPPRVLAQPPRRYPRANIGIPNSTSGGQRGSRQYARRPRAAVVQKSNGGGDVAHIGSNVRGYSCCVGSVLIFLNSEHLRSVPDALESLISEKRLLQAAGLLVRSIKLINKQEMLDIGALSDLRSYLSSQETVCDDCFSCY